VSVTGARARARVHWRIAPDRDTGSGFLFMDVVYQPAAAFTVRRDKRVGLARRECKNRYTDRRRRQRQSSRLDTQRTFHVRSNNNNNNNNNYAGSASSGIYT